MNETLLDDLRYKGEGVDLDYKRTQYRFSGGSAEDKGEMLKDILAMANAWRDGPTHILLGFQELKGRPAEPIGIVDSIDDAQLQTFVRGKVKPRLEFKYQELQYEGVTIGVITIPKQPRPFFLEHDYGRLRSNVVYFRLGSSTAEASPMDIIKMGARDAGKGQAAVELVVQQPDFKPLQSKYDRSFFVFGELPDFAYQRGPFGVSLRESNKHYWRDLAKFVQVRCAAVEVQLGLKNSSPFALTDVKLDVRILEPTDEAALMNGNDLPDFPSTDFPFYSGPTIHDLMARKGRSVDVVTEPDGVVLRVSLGKVLPGELAQVPGTAAVVRALAGHIRLDCRLLASELEKPVHFPIEFEVAGPPQELIMSPDGIERVLERPATVQALGSLLPPEDER